MTIIRRISGTVSVESSDAGRPRGAIGQLSDLIEESAIPPLPDIDERSVLESARKALIAADFYAYLSLTDDQTWAVVADDLEGHVDIRVANGRIQLEVWDSSPGLFAEEESDWRQKALERLARRVVPNVARGFLAENQFAEWSNEDQGVRVRIRTNLPYDQVGEVGLVARKSFPELDRVLTLVESEIRT